MKNDLTMEALQRRKGRNFDSKGFLKEPTPGLNSDDLKNKTQVTMGDGVRKEDLEHSRRNQASSTDDLSPSKQEMTSRGLDIEEAEEEIEMPEDEMELDDDFEEEEVDDDRPVTGGEADAEVYDPDMIAKIKLRGGPKTIMERMQWDLYKKRKK